MANNISKDEDGIAVQLLVDSGTDISTATNLQVIFKTPRKDNITKTGVFTTDGSDGLMQYVKETVDFNTLGVWRVRGKYTLGSTTKYTTWAEFRIIE